MWVDAALKKVKGEGSSVRVPVIRDESNKQLVHQDMYIHFLYIYIYIYIYREWMWSNLVWGAGRKAKRMVLQCINGVS